MMVFSSPDMLCLVWFMNCVKAPMVVGKWRMREMDIQPQEYRQLMFLRQLHRRYLGGDYRHDADGDLNRLRDAGQLLLHWHGVLEGVPERLMQIPTHKMAQAELVPNDFYTKQCPQILASGDAERGFTTAPPVGQVG